MLRGAGLRWRPLHEVQKHRPSRQARPSPSAPAIESTEFSVLFPLFTAIYADFACFSHIDKTTAHGLFRTPIFHFAPFFVYFVPHNPPNPFGTSSKKHQSQFKSVCNAHQHIRVSLDIIHFGYLRSCVSE